MFARPQNSCCLTLLLPRLNTHSCKHDADPERTLNEPRNGAVPNIFPIGRICPEMPPPAMPPTRRSRNGCLDCRRAKVKCDELRPSCGTCARRRHACQGYAKPVPSTGTLAAPSARNVRTPTGPATVSGLNKAAVGEELMRNGNAAMSLPALDKLGFLSLIPPGAVPASDEINIELYFNRHPSELLIGQEFVSEMNANALLILQRDPVRVADTLSAIGYCVSSRRQGGILAARSESKGKDPGQPSEHEGVELLLRGSPLSASRSMCHGARHARTAGPPRHHTDGSGRYLLRALARQDLVVSLVHLRSPRVPTCIWLETNDCAKADRLLGYTATLMPLLEELCILAEDMREQILQPRYLLRHRHQPEVLRFSCSDVKRPSAITPFFNPSPESTSIQLRAASLYHRLTAWSPPITDNTPFLTTRKFRVQAASYRSAALLYLHRLQHPPSSSIRNDDASQPAASETGTEAEADAAALHGAHDVLLYASGAPAAETKLLLWPVFLAACEMRGEEDRRAVGEVLASIAGHRRTVTVERTRRFVEERVWRARDAGEDWNWMVLAQKWPGECLPI
ncbi:Transcriptional regulatory protein moc3 like [Verticillium longisporum]|nr:Transcriptional regulatory protein moc3 like [Verticillium longisporum]